MALSFCRRNLHSFIRNRSNYRHYGGYVVLLPEISPHLPHENPLFKDDYPHFSDITTEKCVNTLGKYLLEFEHNVFAIEQQLTTPENNEAEKEVEYSNGFIHKVVRPLQQPGVSLDLTWGVVNTIFITNDKVLPNAKRYLALHNRAHRAKYSKFNKQAIYFASKKCDVSQLSEEEQRVVEKYQIEGHLNGLGLPDDLKDVLDNFNKLLYLEKTDFNKRIEVSKSLFDVKVIDPYVVHDFPSKLIESMASDCKEPTVGPWTAPVDAEISNKFLEYCPDENLRAKVWSNRVKLASLELENSEIQNSTPLETIRGYRLQIANVLGYPNYATMAMETKMAGNLENVFNVLELFRSFAFERHKEEVESLKQFASASGYKGKIDIYDIPYWSRKQKKSLFNFENEELREYFPFEKVLDGLLQFSEKMFGICFKQSESVSTWHPDVKFYNIYEGDSNRPVAGFYIDPFRRPEKLTSSSEDGWVISIRPAHQIDGCRSVPLSSFILNLPPPIYGKPSLLSYSEVEAIFGLFGKLLQQLLCTVTYTEVAGSSFVEWDAIDVSSHFMKFCLLKPDVLEGVSGHYKTGEKLPVTNMKEVSYHLSGTNLCNELYKSVLDLKMNSVKTFWVDIVEEIWPQHFVFPLSDIYNEPVSMTDIVTGEWTAGYYSHVWSKMIAADLFSAFNDEGADDVSVGTRFRDTYLAFGGSCDPHEIFRRFRGRDPTPKSLIRHFKLDEKLKF